MNSIKKSILLLVVLSLPALCAAGGTPNSAADVIEGYWYAETNGDNGNQKYVLIVEKTKIGFRAETHSYHNGVKFESISTDEVEYSFPNLSIKMNPANNIYFKAEIDTSEQELLGSIVYSNGSSISMNLKRLYLESVQKNFPGLAKISRNSFTYDLPANDKYLKSGDLYDSGINTGLIEEFVNKIYRGEAGALHSLLILKDNKLVFEEYFDGFGRDDLHSLQSCTKSFGSMLVGIAFDKGFIKSLDTPVFDFYPEYKELLTPDWKMVTVKHILTMSAGLDWNDGSDFQLVDRSKNIIKDVLSRALAYKPGEKFDYRNPNVDLIGGIIKHSTGMHADKFAEKYLFAPLGIENYNWDMYKQNGYPLIDGSLALSPRSLAKVGLMMLNKGKFSGKQVLSKEWVDQTFQRHIAVDDLFDYGYLWWIAKSHSVPGVDLYFANGKGSEFIIVCPKLNLVVVTTGANYDMKVHMRSLQLIDQYITKSASIK